MEMLANSWAVFGYVGKQLGRHLYAQTREPSSMPLKVQHMEKSRMILIFQYLCFLRILSFVSSAFLRRVTKRQSCSSIFSGWCRMQDLKRHIRRGPSWLCYRLFDFQKNPHICTEQGSQIYVIERSEWRVEQDVSDILQHFSQGLLKYLKFGNLHLIPALLICYVHFNCSHFSVETEFTFESDIGHSKFP